MTTPAATDPFWKDLSIPYNEQDPNFDFVNPVVVANSFVKGTGYAAQLGEMAETLTQDIKNVEVRKARAERKLYVLRKELFARHYGKITKSATGDIQDAFFRKVATDEQEFYEAALALDPAAKGRRYLDDMVKLEAEIEEYVRHIEARTPQLEQNKARLKLLEKRMEWAKEYLNFAKLEARVNMGASQHGGR